MPVLIAVLALFASGAAHASNVVRAAKGQDVPDKAAPEDKVPTDEEASAPGLDEATPWWSLPTLPALPTPQTFGIDSWTDALRMGQWRSELSTSIGEQQQTLSVVGRPKRKFKSRVTRESLNISNDGFALLDPRLLTGNFGLRLSMIQSRQDSPDATSGQQGKLTDYNFAATVLAEKPFSGTVAANRSQGRNTNSSGGTTQTSNENQSITLRLREDNLLREKGILPWFSANVHVGQEKSREDTQVTDKSFSRDSERKFVTVRAHNGFETADLNFHFEQSDFINHTLSSGSYSSQVANLSYSQDFGANLNRRWDSQINYALRKSGIPTTNLSIYESLSVDHFANLSSGYNYQYRSEKTPVGEVIDQNGRMSLYHRLYNNLTTSVAVNGSELKLPNGMRDSKGAQLSFNYSHGIPWRGALTASMGSNVQVSNNRLNSSLQFVFESHYQAPSSLGTGAGFVLSDRFIVAESIEVLDFKDGARVPTAEGVDYLVVAEGDLIRILPQPTSAIIQPDDLLLVSYQFQLDPSIKYQATSQSMSLGADWRWIGVSVSHEENNQKPLEGGDSSFLISSRRDKARLNLQGEWNEMQARGDAVVTSFDDGKLAFHENTFSQQLTYRLNRSSLLGLAANQYIINYHSIDRKSRGSAINLSANWLLGGHWLSSANLQRRQLWDTKIPAETYSGASLKLQRKWAKLDVSLSLNLTERKRGGSKSRSASILGGAVRRF